SSSFTYVTFDAEEVTIDYTGKITGTIQFTATYNCDVQNGEFPFDEQLCMICFSLVGHRKEELSMNGFAVQPADLY
ncbi:hypothetical protein PFISCL1PPCAC_27454, partial [Pristionchus fissidentatus]